MDFSTDNVEKAVHQFYIDAANQQEINKWLMAAQISPQAWAFSGQLLGKEKSAEVQFFGANTLHMKIARFWHEVPPEQVVVLRSQLMEHVANFAKGPKMVLTRTCVALAALAMQTMPEIWPDAVNNIVSTYQNAQHLQPNEKLTVLLEILTVLPEEFFTAYLATHRRGVLRHELQKATPQVLSMLSGLLRSESPDLVYEQALRCLCSWVQFGLPLVEAEPVILQVFQAVRSEAFIDSAVETLVHVFSHPDNHRFPNTVKTFFAHVVQLQDLLNTAKENQDADQCQGLAKLIVTAGAQNSRLLLEMSISPQEEQRNLAMAMANLVLQCTAIPGHYPVDECCSDLPFCFWYNFQDDIIAMEGDAYRTLAQIYTPVYMSLVNILLQKVQYPPESEYANWHSDEIEAHRCYRQDIADTLMYAYNFLHEPLLGNLCQLFQHVLDKQDTKWQEVEAVLFAVTSIAESVDIDEFLYLPQIFSLLPRVPCNNYKVVSQALFLIGAYAEWMSSHPDVLGSVIPLMLQGLKDTELAQPATLSLKDVVQENQAQIIPYVKDILTASKESLDRDTVTGKDAVRLMSCLGYVLSVLPVTDIMGYLDVLLAPHIQQLQQAGAQQQPTAATKALIQQKLSMLCWLFGSLNVYWGEEEEGGRNRANSQEPQPVLLILQKLLPMLPSVLQTWISDSAIIECLCDMVKKAVRTLMEEFAPLVPDSVTLITQMYTAHPHPALLDLAKQILILFAADDKFLATSQTLFICLASKTLTILQSPNVYDQTDLVEAFMTFLAHIAKKNSQLFANPECNVIGLFQAGILGLGMNESPTVKASCQFLCDLIMCSEKIEGVREVVLNHGHLLIHRLMKAIGGESPRAVVDSMADVFLALNKQHSDQLCQWMNNMVAEPGFPCQRASQAEKEQFARRVIKERVSKRRIKETVQEFALRWRGLLTQEVLAAHGVPIAAATQHAYPAV